MRGRLAGDLLARTGSRALASLFQAATLFILARDLGPEPFGAFAVILSIGYLLSTATSLGTSSRVLRISAEQGGDRLALGMFWLRIGGAAITGAVCLVFSFGTEVNLATLAISIVVSDQVVDFVQAYLAGQGKQIPSSVVVLAQRLIPLAGMLAIFSLDLSLGLLSSIFLVLAFVPAILFPLLVRGRPANLVRTARESGGYWASSVVVSIQQLQVPLLGWMAGSAAAGAFAIALRVLNPLNIFVAAMQTVFVPTMAREEASGRDRSFRLLAGIAWAYGLGVMCLSPLIAQVAVILLGEQYRDFFWLFAAMAVAGGLSAIAQAYQSRLIAIGTPGRSAWVIGTGSCVGLIVLAALAMGPGIDWLGIAPVAGYTVIAGGMILVSRAGRRPPAGSPPHLPSTLED